MPTNIYLASLTPNVNCNVLKLSDYQQGIALNELLPASVYSVIESTVIAQSVTTATSQALPSGSGFVQGTLILSVGRDVGVKNHHTYYLNIPLQLSGDPTIVYVQLKLIGTSTDSNGWFASKCTPDTAGEPWTFIQRSAGPTTSTRTGPPSSTNCSRGVAVGTSSPTPAEATATRCCRGSRPRSSLSQARSLSRANKPTIRRMAGWGRGDGFRP